MKNEKVLVLPPDVLRRLRRNEAPKRGVTARKWKDPASENANRPMPTWIATGSWKGDPLQSPEFEATWPPFMELDEEYARVLDRARRRRDDRCSR